jgi:hypothetical protein
MAFTGTPDSLLTEVNFKTYADAMSFSLIASAFEGCATAETLRGLKFTIKGSFADGTTESASSNVFTVVCPAKGGEGGGGDNEPNTDVTGAFADTSATWTLGGTTSTNGSYADLDVDPIGVYTTAAVAAVKDEIDVVFNGTDLIPASASKLESASLASLYLLTAEDLATINGSKTPVAELGILMAGKLTAEAVEGGAATAGNIFGVYTSQNQVMLVEVISNDAKDGVFIAIRAPKVAAP